MPACLAAAIAALVVTASAVVAAEPNSTTRPVPGTWPNAKQWRQRHEEFVAAAKKGRVDLLFLGDSITDFWRRGATDTVAKFLPEGGGQAVWEKNFAPLKAANFGSCGEGTQHVLWRVCHGELDVIRPKLVVLMIGVNNLALMGNSSEEVAAGIKAIVQTSPQGPCGQSPLARSFSPLGQTSDGSHPAGQRPHRQTR